MTARPHPGLTPRSRRALMTAAAAVMIGGGWSTAGPARAVPVGTGALAGLSHDVSAGQKLQGLFRLTAGSCATGPVTGTYFRMIQPGGSVASGPYMQNTGTACQDKTYTALRPGRDGGLSTAAYQPQPDPPFDSSGAGVNDKITEPQLFYGAKFATATNPVDPQTGITVPVPVLTNDGGGKISGDVRAFAVAYQGQHFNQGAPKPDGSRPGASMPVSGTYNPATKAFSIQWASTIVGGPFDKFTGVWHLEGTFEPATATSPVTAGSAGSTTAPPSAAPPSRTAGASGAAATSSAAGPASTAATAAAPTAAGPGRTAASAPAAGAGRNPAAGIPGIGIPSTGLRFPLRVPVELLAIGLLLRLAGGRRRRPAGR